MAKRKKKTIVKDAVTIAKTGIVLGVGAKAVGATGASAAPVASVASFMPMAGTLVGAKYATDLTKDMIPKKKRKR